jgi:hypothetical protein
MKQNDSPRLKKLIQRQAALQLKIRREQHKLGEQERRRETRRKIIAGAEALAEAKDDPKWGERLMHRLNRNLQREADRQLFDLEMAD